MTPLPKPLPAPTRRTGGYRPSLNLAEAIERATALIEQRRKLNRENYRWPYAGDNREDKTDENSHMDSRHEDF